MKVFLNFSLFLIFIFFSQNLFAQSCPLTHFDTNENLTLNLDSINATVKDYFLHEIYYANSIITCSYKNGDIAKNIELKGGKLITWNGSGWNKVYDQYAYNDHGLKIYLIQSIYSCSNLNKCEFE